MSSDKTERVAMKVKPYLEKVVSCPYCATRSEQPEVKNRLYVERDRDIDLRPKTYLWAIKELETCHPPLYYMWSCQECGHTAAHVHFVNPARAHNLLSSAMQQNFKNLKKNRNYYQIVKLLQSSGLAPLPRTFESGIALHLLALYQLEGIDDISNRETITLGKYYLRTAWLLRDLEEATEFEKEPVKQLVRKLRLLWPDAPVTEEACLERSAALLEAGLETSSAIETTRDEIELILLIARIYMKAGDTRKAKNYGVYSREKLEKYEAELALENSSRTTEKYGEINKLKMTQNAVMHLLADS